VGPDLQEAFGRNTRLAGHCLDSFSERTSLKVSQSSTQTDFRPTDEKGEVDRRIQHGESHSGCRCNCQRDSYRRPAVTRVSGACRSRASGSKVGQGGVCSRMRFLADLRTGGKWHSARVPQLRGQWLEVDPPSRLLVCLLVASWTGKAKTTVRWELEPTNRGTLVRIRHNGLAAHPEVANSHRGWPRMWGRLQALLESGETVDDRRAISAR